MRFCDRASKGAGDVVSTTLFVVLLVVGILAVLVLIWIPILIWLRRRSHVVADQLTREIAGETVVRAPEKGSYRGATAAGYPAVKNTGLIALTKRRLVFRTLTGKSIDVPVESITGVRESTVFKGSVVGGQKHLVIETTAGEVGFYVFSGIADWVAGITALTPGQPAT
jgi:hypothetical protein